MDMVPGLVTGNIICPVRRKLNTASKYCGNDNAVGNVVIKHKLHNFCWIWDVLVQIFWIWDMTD